MLNVYSTQNLNIKALSKLPCLPISLAVFSNENDPIDFVVSCAPTLPCFIAQVNTESSATNIVDYQESIGPIIDFDLVVNDKFDNSRNTIIICAKPAVEDQGNVFLISPGYDVSMLSQSDPEEYVG